jgi:hypothetical protein
LIDFHVDLFETGSANELVDFCRRASAHDPTFAFAIAQDVRDEFELRMPRLICVNEITAGLDRLGESAQRIQNDVVRWKQFVETGDDADGRARLNSGERFAMKRVAKPCDYRAIES